MRVKEIKLYYNFNNIIINILRYILFLFSNFCFCIESLFYIYFELWVGWEVYYSFYFYIIYRIIWKTR